MPRECSDSQHDITGSSRGSGSNAATSEIRCSRCNVRMTVTLRSSGRTVRPDVQIYPATGSTTISRAMVRYFMATVSQTIGEMKADGYQVASYTPTIHAMTTGI
jgi:hypothetical protein